MREVDPRDRGKNPRVRPRTRDWDPRFHRSPLDQAGLEGAVGSFIIEVRRAEGVLRDHLVERGMQPPDRSLAHADHGIIPERGPLPGGGDYWFHGIGAVIKIPGQPAVDVDWTPEGETIIDAFKIQPWLRDHGAEGVSSEQTAAAMRDLMVTGRLGKSENSAHFLVVDH